jgi:hypothetical protein
MNRRSQEVEDERDDKKSKLKGYKKWKVKENLGYTHQRKSGWKIITRNGR